MEPACIAIKDDLHAIECTGGHGYRCFVYVLSTAAGSILIDVTNPDFIPLIERRFARPSALLLTHRHTRAGEAEYEAKFGLRVYLHPEDVAPTVAGAQTGSDAVPPSAYHDPTTDDLLRGLGLRFVRVQGHTEGSLFVYWEPHGGVLFTGDSVVGARLGEAPTLSLPPPVTCDDFERLKASVRTIDLPPLASVLPLHGEALIDAGPDAVQRLWRQMGA